MNSVTSALICYNQRDFLAQALESAVAQEGDFDHEILVADDGSTDGSAGIVADFTARYPRLVSSIGTGKNVGISANYRRCFARARGKYIAILEGDDYWCDPRKLAKQATFLDAARDVSMVFSRIELRDERSGTSRLLERQEGLETDRLTGRHFLDHRTHNLIVNLSSCMFQTAVMRALPEILYDGRLSEIALAFHLERLGPIGFLNEVMGVYRQHAAGAWTGIGRRAQLQSALAIRQVARRVARPEYHEELDAIVEGYRRKLLPKKA